MSASQARLLSLTARLSDKEFQAQQISNSRTRLADQSEAVTKTYSDALNQKKISLVTGFNNSTPVYQDLSYDLLVGANSPLGTQYALTNTDNQVVVPQDMYDNFTKAGSNVNTFIGLCSGSTAHFSTAYTTASNALEAARPAKTTAVAAIQKAQDAYDTEVATLAKSGITETTMEAVLTNASKLSPTALITNTTAPTTPSAVTKEDYTKAVSYLAKITAGTMTAADIKDCVDGLLKDTSASNAAKLADPTSTDAVVNNHLEEQIKNVTNMTNLIDGIPAGTNPVTAAIPGLDLSNDVLAFTSNTSPAESVGFSATKYVLQGADATSGSDTNTIGDYMSGNVANFPSSKAALPAIVKDTKYLGHGLTSGESYTTEAGTAPLVSILQDIKSSYETNDIGYADQTSTTATDYGTAAIKAKAYASDLGVTDADITAYTKAKTDLSTAKTTYQPDIDTFNTLQTKLDGISSAVVFDDGVKVSYYTNLYNRMLQGAKPAADATNTINNRAWLENQLKSGGLVLEKVDTDNKWVDTSWDSSSEIVQQNDDTQLAIVKAQYDVDLGTINNKDKKFELELKAIDTEHSAMQTELESVKKVIDKNIESSFKTFG